MHAKNIVIALIALTLIGAVAYLYLTSQPSPDEVIPDDAPETAPADDPMPVEPDEGIGDGAEPLEPTMEERGEETVLGTSVEGTPITAYHFGDGNTEILLVGGVHGGYSPNTADLADEFVAYYQDNEEEIPENLMLTVVPNLNPDGMDESGAAGRFNANDVDLNRNFDCEWSETGTWRSQEVSGGSAPFSEPEAAALRDYVETYDPTAAVVWFSQEGKVYPSACGTAPSDASVALAETFAAAADYPTEAEFDAYTITGDMVNWMAKNNIPAISVLLSNHQNTEWNKNVAGVEAVMNAYAN